MPQYIHEASSAPESFDVERGDAGEPAAVDQFLGEVGEQRRQGRQREVVDAVTSRTSSVTERACVERGVEFGVMSVGEVQRPVVGVTDVARPPVGVWSPTPTTSVERRWRVWSRWCSCQAPVGAGWAPRIRRPGRASVAMPSW